MRRRSKSYGYTRRRTNTDGLRRRNSLQRLTGPVHLLRFDDYDVYNTVVRELDIQECDLSNHIRYMEIRHYIIFKPILNIGKCSAYHAEYPFAYSPGMIMHNSLGNLLRIRYLRIDTKCNLSITILNKLTRLRVISFTNVVLTGDNSYGIILSKLRSLSMVSCRLEDGTTYDLLNSLNSHSKNMQYISVRNMTGEDVHEMKMSSDTVSAISNRPLPIDNMRLLRHLHLEECYLNASITSDSLSKLLDSLSLVKIVRSLLTSAPYTLNHSKKLINVRTHKVSMHGTEIKYYDLYIINAQNAWALYA